MKCRGLLTFWFLIFSNVSAVSEKFQQSIDEVDSCLSEGKPGVALTHLHELIQLKVKQQDGVLDTLEMELTVIYKKLEQAFEQSSDGLKVKCLACSKLIKAILDNTKPLTLKSDEIKHQWFIFLQKGMEAYCRFIVQSLHEWPDLKGAALFQSLYKNYIKLLYNQSTCSLEHIEIWNKKILKIIHPDSKNEILVFDKLSDPKKKANILQLFYQQILYLQSSEGY